MAEVILVMGPSGAGKSTSIRTLDPKETFIFNTLGKNLPFKGSGKSYTYWDKEKNPSGNMVRTVNSNVVLKWLEHINKNMPNIKNVVIEDNTHLSSMEYLKRIKETNWDKFNDIALNMVNIVTSSKDMREDLVVFILHHVIEIGDGLIDEKSQKAMTIGKLVNEKLSSYESFFTTVLLATKKKDGNDIKYVFLTKDVGSTAKSPMGMFEDVEIPNDLSLVRDKVMCFYNEEKDC